MKALLSAGDILSGPTARIAVTISDSTVHPGRKIAQLADGRWFELTPSGLYAPTQTKDGAYGQFQIDGKEAVFPETGRVATLNILDEA